MLARRTLGFSGLEVGVIGLGGAGFGGVYGQVGEEQAVATIRRAIELGVNYLDTAPSYGTSEQFLGPALEGLRDRVILATKAGLLRGRGGRELTYDGILRSVEESLKLLRTDYLDILQYHEIQPAIADQVLADDGPLGALRRLRDEGVCRYLGITGRDLDTLGRAVRTGEFTLALTYMEYSPLTLAAQSRLFPVTAERNVGLVAGSPLVAGLLTGSTPEEILQRRPRTPSDKLDQVRRLQQLAAAHGWSVPELSLAFELADPRVTVLIPGASSPAEVTQNVAAAGRELPAELLQGVREISSS